MILRRIAHHIRRQDWTAIGIELLIVILGVFLGFQVTDWAGDRADRAAERRHLEEIAQDLRADVESLRMVRTSAAMRISSIDYILGETRGVTRQAGIRMPTGEVFDMPAGAPIDPDDRDALLSRANLVRASRGNRTGYEALIGAGGMQTIRDRQIGRQIQVYYAQFEELISTQDMLRAIRSEGVAIGYPLGLSAFGDMDPDRLIAIVRGSPAYSAYLRTAREWASIHLANTEQQIQRAQTLLGDIDRHLGKQADAGA